MDRCQKIVNLGNQEYIGSLCEALLHFMLTACTLPSGRKVRIDNINLDIPVFIRLEIILKRQLSYILTSEPLLGDYVNYTVGSGNSKNTPFPRRNFHDIIVDIDAFLEQTKDRSLRFFH